MKNIVKSVISVAAVAAFSVLPLAASAYSLGVTNSINSSIEQGHTSSWDNYSNKTNGSQWSSSTANKSGDAVEVGHTDGLVIDPASTNNTIVGKFHETASTKGGSNSNFSNTASGGHNLSGGSQVNTSLSLGVGTYFNP